MQNEKFWINQLGRIIPNNNQRDSSPIETQFNYQPTNGKGGINRGLQRKRMQDQLWNGHFRKPLGQTKG
jgi:hypothetical protein